MFKESCEKFKHRPCLGFRPIVNGEAKPYEWMTYAEVEEKVIHTASGFASLGLKPREKVGVLGANSPEWMIAMQACNRQNLTCVPLYDTLGESAVEFIIQHSEARLVVVSAAKLPILVKALPSTASQLLAVVYWGKPTPEQIQAAEATGVKVVSLDSVQAQGQAAPAPPSAPGLDDLCTIMYTSGTTGDPKGVLIRHSSLMATIEGANLFLKHHNVALSKDDVYLSYLPLAHIFDRLVEEFLLHLGGSVGYWQGDPRKVMDDVAALKPTFFAGVPRIFDRVYNGVREQVARKGGLTALVFDLAFKYKLAMMKWGFSSAWASPLADALVFHKLKEKLGGRVRILLSGAAPLGKDCEEFLKVCMCAPMVQGYGLTETCAASFIGEPENMKQTGTVGAPMPQTEFRLEAVPEMGYDPLAYPPRGEVCLRGPGVFAGYFKLPDQTAEVMDEEGFFHTGDIAELTAEGAVRIIDRKKNIFKLSQGEYIAAERVENTYKTSLLVEQIWVYGNSFESCVVAVVVPGQHALKDLAASLGVEGSFEELCKSEAVKKAALKELQAAGRAKGLKGFEEIKALYLDPEAFSVENDLVTPSFKLKRAPLLKHYKKEIDVMYQSVKASGR